MPGSLYGRYGMHELEAMARRGSVLSGEIDFARLPRLAGLVESDRGSVRAHLRFRQHGDGWPIMLLEYETTVRLVCQRCLAAVEYRLEDRIEFAVLGSASLERYLPKEYEPLVLEGDERLMPATLVEDEIILALPLVPRHEPADACPSAAGRSDHPL